MHIMRGLLSTENLVDDLNKAPSYNPDSLTINFYLKEMNNWSWNFCLWMEGVLMDTIHKTN
jgi:hypothetical protein